MQPTSPSRRRILHPVRRLVPPRRVLPACDSPLRPPCPRLLQQLGLLALILALTVQALLPIPAAAQLIPQRQWAVFRQSQGLLSNDAHAILVDGSTLWFGTDKGVNRFDGRWQSFPISLIGRQVDRRRNPATPGAVIALAQAADGQGIWLATEHGFVARWDGERWELTTTLAATIYDIVDIGGTLWLATSRGLSLLVGDQVQAVTALTDEPVYDLYVDSDTVWVGAATGLWRLSRDAASAEHVPVAVIPADDEADLNLEDAIALHEPAAQVAGPIRALWSDGAGVLWFGMGLQVVQFDPRSGVGLGYRPFDERSDAYWITAIAGKPGESLWVTSNGAGVVHYMFADGKLAATSNLGADADGGLDADDVRALAIDQDTTIWFSTPVGVFRYQPWAWLETAGAYDGVSINDVLYDRSGVLWVATNGEGVQRRRSLYANVETFYPYDTALPSENVTDLEEDPAGRIWAATPAGLAVYADGAWSAPIDPVRLPAPQVTAIKADKSSLWIGTSAGLLRYALASGHLQTVPDFEGQAIGKLEIDLTGRLWVAPLSGGLWLRAQDGHWADAFNAIGAPPMAQVTALLADPHQPGGMYAAILNGGVYNWTGDTWTSIDRRRWPQGDRIQVLAMEPSDDSLWIGSEIGLSRLDNLSLITYDSHDGMQNGAIRAIARQPDGGYWFGGQKGLSHYDLERTPPWVRVSGIASEGAALRSGTQTLYAGRPVEFSYQAGDIQSAAEELRIFYRIKHGAAVEPWHEVRNGSFELRFNAPGTAAIEIMARDQSFNYSQPQVLTMAVLPPPVTVSLPLLGQVEERIFRLLLLFAGLALLGFGYVSFEIFQHNRRVTDAVRRGFNPYISGEPVRRQEMFFGRHNLLDRIVSTLHNNSIMIHGERRIGKTTLLYQIANVLRQVNDAEYWFVPVMIDLEGTSETQLFPQIIDEVVQAVELLPNLSIGDDQVLRYLLYRTLEPGLYTDREFGRDLRTIVRLLEEYSVQNEGGRQVRLILLLDEGDTLSQFNHIYQQQLRRIFMRDFAATLGAVVAGIQISKEWDRVESPWYNLFNEIAMAPFTRAQAIELLVEPVRGYYIYEPDAIEYILDLCDGRPFRIQQYALEAVNHMLKENRRRILRRDVEFAHEQLVALSVAHADSGAMAVQSPWEPDQSAVLPAPDARLLGSAAD